jgi:hypothetical protein
VVVTSDNPRTEDPQRILADLVTGIAPGTAMHGESDRAQAITDPSQIRITAQHWEQAHQAILSQRDSVASRG